MIKKWKKSGPEKLLLRKFGKFAKRQIFIDPRDGSGQEYIFVGEPDSVGIVALTRSRKIILIRQFKQAANKVLIEVPAGALNRGEAPLAAAKRELEEETGFGARKFMRIGTFMRSTRSIPTLSYAYLALDCYKVKNPRIDHEEELEVITKPFNAWVGQVKKGRIPDALSVIGTLLAADHLKHV